MQNAKHHTADHLLATAVGDWYTCTCIVPVVYMYALFDVTGGLTGLFLGASVISVLEVLEVIIRIAAKICCKKRENKQNKVTSLEVKPREEWGHREKSNLFLV